MGRWQLRQFTLRTPFINSFIKVTTFGNIAHDIFLVNYIFIIFIYFKKTDAELHFPHPFWIFLLYIHQQIS